MRAPGVGEDRTTDTWSVKVPPLGVYVTGRVLMTNPLAVTVASLQSKPTFVATAVTTVPLFWMTTGLVQTGVWSDGVEPSSVQRMSAPTVDVRMLTRTDPSNDPLLGEMVGAAALTRNALEVATSLSSRFGLLARALTTTFDVFSTIKPV